VKIQKDSWGKWVLVTKTHAYSLEGAITQAGVGAILFAIGAAILLLDQIFPGRGEDAVVLLVIAFAAGYVVREIKRPR
jgi:hypothetical protein